MPRIRVWQIFKQFPIYYIFVDAACHFAIDGVDVIALVQAKGKK